MKDFKKVAQFPGFRKGQIPPYAQPKMTNFALQEVLVSSCQEAITRFGVNEINEGQLGAVNDAGTSERRVPWFVLLVLLVLLFQGSRAGRAQCSRHRLLRCY